MGEKKMFRVFDQSGELLASGTSIPETIADAMEKRRRRQEPETVRESLALKRKANALRKSMEASLAARGRTEQIYSDMVGDYLELWWTRAELEADIRERGVTVMDEKRGLPVENCSVSARVRVSAQMGKMYKAMGFQELAVKNQAPDGEDDEL